MKEYKTKHICRNCHTHVELLIPMGVSVKEFFKNKKCEFCGCDPLIQSLITDKK